MSEVAPLPLPLPVETAGAGARPHAGGWLARCGRTLLAVLFRPRRAFGHVPEPVEHAKVLRFLATLRLPLWGALVAVLGVQFVMDPQPGLVPTRAIHAWIDPSFIRAFSTFVLLLIPVSIPLLYFGAGLLAHIGIALTGGAPRSIGVSMRAVGYAMGPWYLVVGLLDIPLYLGVLPSLVPPAILPWMALQFMVTAGVVLARSHQISMVRGLLVALLPTLLVVLFAGARIVALLPDLPGTPEPPSPYFVP